MRSVKEERNATLRRRRGPKFPKKKKGGERRVCNGLLILLIEGECNF